jgi:hypothetical protein
LVDGRFSDFESIFGVLTIFCSAVYAGIGPVSKATKWTDKQNNKKTAPRAGLPDGLFSNQKSQFWSNLEGLGMEKVVIFFDHLEDFMAIWYKLWSFGKVCGLLVYFLRFGMFGPRKIWQPWSQVMSV